MAHVNCPKCGDRFPFPTIREKRDIRCPICTHRFTFSPQSQTRPMPDSGTGKSTRETTISPPGQPQVSPNDGGKRTEALGRGGNVLAKLVSILFWTFFCLAVMGFMLEQYPYESLDPVGLLKHAPFMAAYAVFPFLISLLPVACIRPRDNAVGFAVAAAGGAFVGLLSQMDSSTTGSVINGVLVGLVPGVYWASFFARARRNDRSTVP